MAQTAQGVEETRGSVESVWTGWSAQNCLCSSDCHPQSLFFPNGFPSWGPEAAGGCLQLKCRICFLPLQRRGSWCAGQAAALALLLALPACPSSISVLLLQLPGICSASWKAAELSQSLPCSECSTRTPSPFIAEFSAICTNISFSWTWFGFLCSPLSFQSSFSGIFSLVLQEKRIFCGKKWCSHSADGFTLAGALSVVGRVSQCLQLLQQEPQGVSCPSPPAGFPRYQWHCWVWETPVLLPVVLVPVRDREINLKLKLSALHNSVFIEATNLQNGLQLPKCLVLFFISSQTNKLKCQV